MLGGGDCMGKSREVERAGVKAKLLCFEAGVGHCVRTCVFVCVRVCVCVCVCVCVWPAWCQHNDGLPGNAR